MASWVGWYITYDTPCINIGENDYNMRFDRVKCGWEPLVNAVTEHIRENNNVSSLPAVTSLTDKYHGLGQLLDMVGALGVPASNITRILFREAVCEA